MRPDHDDRDPKAMRTRPDGRIVDERDERDPELPDLRDLRERGRQDNPATMTGTGSWQDIKGRFVDDPAGAIAAAEQLVQRAVDDKIRALKDEAAALCARERDDGEASTETMRARLLRCQAYCERLSARSQ